LLECALSEPNSSQVKNLEKQINSVINEAIEKKIISKASVYLHDLSSGSFIGINRAEKFSPASLLKVPLMISYLKIAEKNPEILEFKLLVEKQDFVSVQPNIIPLKSVKENQEYTVEELIRYSIHYSDNKAANTLLKNIPEETLSRVYDDLGIKLPGLGNDENFMNIMDYASFFEILYNASYLNREMSEIALSILADSSFGYGLSAGVPINIEVAHKFGERIINEDKQLHDCGIIYYPNNPYLLCVMTRTTLNDGNSFNKMANIIKNISQTTYRYFDAK